MNIIKILNKVSIRNQLIIMALALCFMLGIGGLFGILDSYIINQKAVNIAKTNQLSNDAMELKSLFLQERVYSEEILNQNNKDDLILVWGEKLAAGNKIKEIETRLEKYEPVRINYLDSADANQKSYEEITAIIKKIIDTDNNEYEPALQAAYKTKTSIIAGKTKEIDPKIKTSIDTASEKIVQYTTELESKSALIIEEAIKSANDTYNIAWYQLLFMISLAVAMTTFAAIYFTGTITKPLKRLENTSKELAEGNFKINIDADILERGDEIGVLGNSISTVITNFREITSKIKDSANSLSSIGNNLSQHSKEVKDASAQVSATIQEISKGNQNLSKTAYDNQKEAEILIKSIEIVTNSVENSTRNANEANTIAKEGSKASKIAMDKIHLIKETVSASATAIDELNDKVQQINKIVEVITSVSEQTNLLALNAAIEAARAGESGRGFAVVADEVRKLAEESQKSTSQIEAMIKEIKASTANAVSLMDKGTVQVDESIKIISEALNSLELISDKMGHIASDVNEINKASEQQIKSSKGVQKSIIEVSSVAEESAAGAEEVVASSMSTTNSMHEIASSADQLAANSNELKKLIERFKL